MTNQEIKTVGQTIAAETQIGGNTAERVGGVIEGIGEALDNKDAAVGYYLATMSGSTIYINASSYRLGTGGNLRAKMPAAATTACTLTVGNANAVPLWYNGAAVSADNSWEAGEIVTIFYDGTRFMTSNSQGGGGQFGSGEKIKDILLSQALGDGTGTITSQKGVSDAIFNEIDISSIDSLKTLNDALAPSSSLKPTYYTVTATLSNVKLKVGSMAVISDNMRHVVTEIMATHYLLDDAGNLTNEHSDAEIFFIYRSVKLSGGTLPDPAGTWTKWRYVNSSVWSTAAEKIKYDNSQSGLSAENVQGALDEVGAEMFIDGDSLSMGNPINYIISVSSWVWTAQNSKHYLVKVNAGDKIKVTANSNTTAVCIWLTSNAAPSNNSPAPVVSQSSTIIQANESVTITAPQTAEYLYLMGVHSSVEHKPSSVIKVDGIKQTVVDLDENAFRNHADYSNIPITWSLGYVQATDGAIKTMTGGNYYYSQLISVDGDTVCKIKAGGSPNVLTIAMYSSNNTTTADLTKSIIGTQAEQNLEFIIPDGIAYIRITNNTAIVALPEVMKAFVAADYVLNKLKEHESEIQELSELADSLEDRMPSLEQEGSTTRYTFTDAESGYYRDTDHAVVDSQYWYHKSIPFAGGENAKLYYTSSPGNTAASCFFKIGNTYQRFGRDSGGSAVNPVPINVDIPAGTTEILISVNSGVKDTAYAEITIPAYIPEDAVSERMVKELLKKELLSTGLNLKKRRASVSFIFDDGVAGDVSIKAIFDNHSKKCGFAVFSPIASRYKTYYDEGFEILAHASAPISSPTEASERAQMKTAYDNVVALVGECHGWVTPNSALADQFKPLVYDYYEYGYTVYKGNIATPSESGMTKDMKSYALWRSSVESLTLAEQKAIIDYAVANNLMVCFYGHAYNLNNGGNFTSANLNELLSYCDTVGIDVMLPYESVSNFFAFRHNEDL